MKARIKFSKYGVMKFIGHLDMMRYFQKAIRRAGIPIAFSGGFSPHMIMSFANPLGVGLTSDAEYFDIELTEPIDFEETKKRLDEKMVEGVRIINIVPISDEKKKTGMAIVAAADYLSKVRQDVLPDDLDKHLQRFLLQPQILITKATKKSEKEVDIRPMIYHMEERDGGVFMQIATGSVENLKPELVMQALIRFLGLDDSELVFTHHRTEVYADLGDATNHQFVSLDRVPL